MVKIKKEKSVTAKKYLAKKKVTSKIVQVKAHNKVQPASEVVSKPAKKQKQITKTSSGKKRISKVITPKTPKSTLITPSETKSSLTTIAPVKERTVIPEFVPASKIKKAAIDQRSLEEAPLVVKEKRVISKKEEKPTIEHKPIAEKQSPVAEEKITIKPRLAEEAITVKPVALAKTLELTLPITLKDLAVKLQEKPSVLIQTLIKEGLMVGINQVLDERTVAKICEKYHCQLKKAPGKEELALRMHQEIDKPELLRPRSPIVTFMGHVDHGKTSLLDAIRKTKVAESEHGGITQHTGAYRVILQHGEITFLDTPGHEAFTAMRARGASLTDIVVLVVAADDGIMPQTQEAIDHARAAGVAIIVALNKIDKPQANVDRVKKQLAEVNLTSEDWGGKTITVPVSAKTGQGIDDLLEMLLLEAQMLELKANPNRLAKGVVVEAKMTKGRGPVATLLIQNGTLHLNENIIVGKYYGKIRAMFNDRGHSISEAGPSFPVEILGLSNVPQAGEQFFVVEDERTSRELAVMRQEEERQEQVKAIRRINLEDLHAQIKEGKLKELKLVIKADVQGSLEAIKDTLNKLNVSEIKLDIIHEAAGNINPSDVILAVASNALILGFNVDSDERAKELIAKEGVDVRTYNIIYELANDIKAALEGMLEPRLKKVFQGRVEVRKVFKLSRSGTVAGCFVVKGKITRNVLIDLIRNGDVVFEGKLSSLKRFKDDVREVMEGFECGITLSGFEDLKEGDIIEAYDIEKIARKL
jgi:translation initiation factor IF-2